MQKSFFSFFFLFLPFFWGGVLFGLSFGVYLGLLVVMTVQTLLSLNIESRDTVRWVSQELFDLVQPLPQHSSWAYHMGCFSPLPLLNKMSTVLISQTWLCQPFTGGPFQLPALLAFSSYLTIYQKPRGWKQLPCMSSQFCRPAVQASSGRPLFIVS